MWLRRSARVVQLAIAVPITLALAWLEVWWAAPLPLALSFLAYEALVRSRGDRPSTLVLGPEKIEVHDPARGEPLVVPLAEVELASATWQRTRGRADVVLMLADRGGPRLAVRFGVAGEPPVEPGHVDADAVDAILGGQGTALRAVAPFELAARQRFDDRRGLPFFREHLPASRWTRAGLRLWAGAEPPLDTFGYHVGDADEWLVLDGPGWELRRARTGEVLATGDLSRLEATSRARSLSLVLAAGEAPEPVRVPLLALELAPDLRIHVPAPTAAPLAPGGPASGTDRHTHPAEGAALLWHVLRHATALPDAIRAAVRAAGLPPDRLPPRPDEPPAARSATLPPR